MGIVLLGIILIYLIFLIVVLSAVKWLSKSNTKVLLVGVFLLFIPFWRPLLCSFLFSFYRMQPLQEVFQVVDLPISVYWQDNVWPGYDKFGRNWMIDQYLDGVHLKVLALNGDDKKIYLYRAEELDFSESRKALRILKKCKADYFNFVEKNKAHIKQHKKPIEGAGDYLNRVLVPAESKAWKDYYRIKEEAIKQIVDRVEIYESSETLPFMRYRVDFNLVDKGLLASKLFHIDEVVITDVEKNTVIAFSQRYLAYGNWLSQFGGANPDFYQILGDELAYEFDDKVLFGGIDSWGSRQGRDRVLLEKLSKYFRSVGR